MIKYNSIEYVVDASFILQAILIQKPSVQKLFSEIFSQEKKYHIVAPDFLRLETRNVLRFAYDNITLLQEALDTFNALSITFLESNVFFLDQATISAFQTKTTVYNSLYHILAIQRKATFLTCDKKYYQAAKSLGHIELVE
jgi:predicted nucleic acid-binding protein